MAAAPTEAQATTEDEPAAPAEAVEASEAKAAEPADAEGTGSAEIAAEAEVPLIEVWHPNRHHHAGKRPERHRGRPHRRDNARGEAGAEAVPASPAAAQAATEPAERDAGEPDPRRREDFRRSDRETRPGGDRRRSESKPENRRPEGKPGDGRGRFQGKFSGQGRRDNDRDARQGDRPFATTEKPAARERQPDPNSPFAKLLVLKAELERRAKKENP